MIVLSRSSATCVAGGGEGWPFRYAYSSSSTSQMFSGFGHLSGVDLSGDADLFLIGSDAWRLAKRIPGKIVVLEMLYPAAMSPDLSMARLEIQRWLGSGAYVDC